MKEKQECVTGYLYPALPMTPEQAERKRKFDAAVAPLIEGRNLNGLRPRYFIIDDLDEDFVDRARQAGAI